jgi:threonine/homoserine/homoserine lactone efflux protein
LIWLGIKAIRAKDADGEVDVAPESLTRIFTQGIAVNLLNPKSALFFFAFLPQFVKPGNGSPTAQILILGFIFLAMAMTTDAVYALLAGTAGGWLRTRMRALRYVSGAIYIALGISAAVTGSRTRT